jgi:hypothetical protein
MISLATKTLTVIDNFLKATLMFVSLAQSVENRLTPVVVGHFELSTASLTSN